MRKVGLTLLRRDWQSPLSPHFGLATWLLIYDAKTGHKSFERNRLLMGKGVADEFAQHRCTDAVFSSIGPGALEILRGLGISAWYGPADVPASELIDRLERGELEAASEARTHGHDRSHGHSHRGRLRGCCRGEGKRRKRNRAKSLSSDRPRDQAGHSRGTSEDTERLNPRR
jgi:predicted Fe-Mo cluster-binding NifX family protein